MAGRFAKRVQAQRPVRLPVRCVEDIQGRIQDVAEPFGIPGRKCYFQARNETVRAMRV